MSTIDPPQNETWHRILVDTRNPQAFPQAHTHTHTEPPLNHYYNSCRSMEVYGRVSGYRLNVDKCGVVFQGPDTRPPGTVLYGVQVRSKVKYLGTWLGHATVLDEYQGPLAKLMVKVQFLTSLPLKEEEKIQALYT